MSRTIAGYRLGERLGQGSKAAVYVARDERLHYQVAVKVLAPDPARDAAYTGTLIRESQAAAGLDHPHIIPVYDAGEEDGTPYIVMRYARGGDARSLLRRRGALPLRNAWRIIAQIASALDTAHAQGLVHRDVKPANILFDVADTVGGRRPGPGGDQAPAHAYLSDFGVGRAFPPGLVTGAEQITDALDYLAPEQIEGDDLDGRADLYALACTSYELLCGAPPFGAEQGLTLMYSHLYAPPPVAAARRAGLPAAVDPVLARALAKDPADRYPSCGRFAAELRAALGLSSFLRAGPAPSRASGLPATVPSALAPPRPARPTLTQSSPLQASAGQQNQASARQQNQAGPAQLSPAQANLARPGSYRAGRRDPAGLTGTSMLIAPAPEEFTPAPLSRDYPSAVPAAGNRRETTADWLTPGTRPAAPPDHDEPRGQRRLLAALAAAAVVVVLLAVVAVLSLGRHPGSGPSQAGAAGHPAASPRTSAPASPPASAPASPSLAAQQASALDTLLISSSAARTALHRAVKQVATCTNLAGAISDLQNVVNQRTTEAGRASALTVSALPGGAQVKSVLTTALSLSLKADQDYLTWARQQRSGGCTPSSQSGTYNAAFSESQQADNAKAAFVKVWNPVAARYGLSPNSPRDI